MPWSPDISNVSEYTRPATWEDVKHLARLLNEIQNHIETIDLDGMPLPLLDLEAGGWPWAAQDPPAS
jgi:hypothetical protein